MSIENPNLASPPPLNLPDGEFLVHRSNGDIEQGWRVEQTYNANTADGSQVFAAVITKPDERTGKDFVKTVPVDTLLSWQTKSKEGADKYKRISGLSEAIGSVGVAADQGRYDFLFNKNNAYADTNEVPLATPEDQRDPRLKKLFAPIPTIDMMPQSEPESYDYLFTEDPEDYRAKVAEASHKSMQRHLEELKYSVVDDETKAGAVERLRAVRRRDPSIDKIIRSYERVTDSKDPATTVDLIRTNSDLRYDLGRYLLKDKLPVYLYRMPERITSNSGKNPNHRGYQHLPRMTSQEYSVLLALAMIDGTYKDPGAGDAVELNGSGKVTVGQHRAAAEELLS